MHRHVATLLALFLVVPALQAQDRRTVTEPVIPSACTTLRAALAVVGDSTISAADERRGDDERIQRAIDACPAGQSVRLVTDGAHGAFLSGPLQLRSGVTLVVERGATLFASRDPRQYDLTPGSCGTVTKAGHGCRPFIAAEKAAHAGVMGDGTIDGRGWATLLGTDVSWWMLAQQAKVENLNQSCPRLIQVTKSDDFTMYRITLRNSPNFHVVFDRGDGFTAWAVHIRTPKTARNTDGIDPASATNVTIAHSDISTGDDDVAIKGGSTGPTTNVSVLHNHFYSGHGMSIGSETDGGVHDILVRDLTIDGADNGLRIKSNASRGGLVHGVTYEDVCIRATKSPIEMDTHYTASAETTGSKVPEFRDIILRGVRIVDGGKLTLDGYDRARPLGVTFDGVTIDSGSRTNVRASHVRLVRGPGAVSTPVIEGEDVTVREAGVDGRPAPSCDGRFVDFPR